MSTFLIRYLDLVLFFFLKNIFRIGCVCGGGGLNGVGSNLMFIRGCSLRGKQKKE